MDELVWRKASVSAQNGNCVEVAVLPSGEVGVRDSKDPEGAVLKLTGAQWFALADWMKAGTSADLLVA